MLWLIPALLSAVVSGVGFWRGTALGLGAEALPAAAGVLFSLLVFRAQVGLEKTKKLEGGWPLSVAGAAALTAAAGAAYDVIVWLTSRHSPTQGYLLPFAAIGFVMTAISALRLSATAKRKTQFYVLALACLGNAAACVVVFRNLFFAVVQTT